METHEINSTDAPTQFETATRWTRKHSVVALVLMMVVQIFLINHFRTGLLGSDDMTAAFSGKRLVNEFDMTIAFTNLPMSMRTGMCLPLGVLQFFLPVDTSLWVFPLLCAIPLAPLAYLIGRQLRMSRIFSLVAAALLSCTPAVVFNSSVALTEVPLLVVTLAALLCFLKGLPKTSEVPPEQTWVKRRGWLVAAGVLTGVLFSIKVSAVALIASLTAYAFLREKGTKQRMLAASMVCAGFAAVIALEMGMWATMSGNPLHRGERIRLATSNSRANMRDIYRQTSQQDLIAKYGRYASHFVGSRASFGNLFPLLFVGWAAGCLFAKRYRMFLIVYAGPQILYLWYLITFYPSTQPRYAIQFLPFVAFGALLLMERWKWTRTTWGTAAIVLLVGQSLAMGMRARSNQYRADNLFFARYTHEKTTRTSAPVYVDGRTVSIFHTLNDFKPSQAETLWQYPVYRDMRVGERRRKEKKYGVYPWRETNLEDAHGFVAVDLRLTRWLRRRLKSPESIDVPPPNWILADSAFPEKKPTLGGVVYYASPQITAEQVNGDPDLQWSGKSKWFRQRSDTEPVQLSSEIVKFEKNDLLVMGEGGLTRPGLKFLPGKFTVDDQLYAFVEFDIIVEPADTDEALYLPTMRLFSDRDEVTKVRFPETKLDAGRHTLRFPFRLSKPMDGMRFCLQFLQSSDVRITVPRIFVQHLSTEDRTTMAAYDGVAPKLDNIVSLPTERAVR